MKEKKQFSCDQVIDIGPGRKRMMVEAIDARRCLGVIQILWEVASHRTETVQDSFILESSEYKKKRESELRIESLFRAIGAVSDTAEIVGKSCIIEVYRGKVVDYLKAK